MSRDRLPPPQAESCLTSSRASSYKGGTFRYKGGTCIAEDVWSPDEHQRRLSCPDRYRPKACGRCGHQRLHVHDYPERKPLGLAMLGVLRVVRFICTNPSCGATWRILPAFLARHLGWVWMRVEQATMAPPDQGGPTPAKSLAKVATTEPATLSVAPPPKVPGLPPTPETTTPPDEVTTGAPADSPSVRAPRMKSVPERTRLRWLARLDSSARQLVVLLATTGAAAVSAVAEKVSLDSTRRDLIETYSASFFHEPGTRLASLAALIDRLERGIRLM